MLERILFNLWNYRMNMLLPQQEILIRDLHGVMLLEDIGEDVQIKEWPGKGLFISLDSQEPNNITYLKEEIIMVDYSSIDALSRYTNIIRYREQQLN